MTRIAVTGTPGVGKSTLCRLAAERHGWRVVDVKAWAHEAGAVVGHDTDDESDVIDVAALADALPPDDGSIVLYDGHLAHLLPVDEVWVVRCDPFVLGRRLRLRGYRNEKALENMEAEAMDLILQEALDDPAPGATTARIGHDSHGVARHVIQRDGTHRTPEELLASFVDAHQRELNRNDLESVDWSHRLPLR